MPSDWQQTYKKLRDLAGTVFPVSEEVLLKAAREHGIGRKMGRSIVVSADDCEKLYEALPCLSNSLSDRNRPTGSCAAPSAESALRVYGHD